MRVYEAPPESFDPQTAPHALLRRHGFPPRPDPETDPQRARIWTRAFRRPVTYVTAQLAIDEVMSARRPLPARRSSTDFGVPIANFAGVARVQDPPGGGSDFTSPATMVFAQWIVPEIIPVEPGSDDQTVAFWVGLDGAPENIPEAAATQVLQAGIAATVSPHWYGNSTVRYWAWTEWFADPSDQPAVEVTNFPVAPGDLVTFLVCAPTPDTGHFSMLNNTQGFATSVSINAPDGITSVGASAEWVVEQVSSELPYFHYVMFSDCAAGSTAELFNLEPFGAPMEIVDAGDPPGTSLAKPIIVAPTLALVAWEGFY
jgi:Peptidase A4 family